MTRRNLGWTILTTLFVILSRAPDLCGQEARGVTLIKDGQAQAAIFVAAELMQEDLPGTAGLKNPAREVELQRQRLRESVKDLAAYLKKLSGAEVQIVSGAPPAGESQAAILIGDLAAQKFGGPGKSYPFKQGFRVVVKDNTVGLLGESDLATSYAIYEVLDRLGCRWYMSSEMGEVIPALKTITLAETDESLAPGTIYRTIWYADEAYKRRNRMGGLPLQAGHALEITGNYLTAEDKQNHPEWISDIDGKKVESRIKWSNKEVAAFIADKIVAMHQADPQPSYSIAPDDGASWDNSAEDRALDAGDFDPSFQEVSITDRYMVLANRIAERVAAQRPEVLLGFLAYVQYTRSPVRESVHPNLVPMIAPITYSRAHPMNMDDVPDNKDLRHIVTGWGKKSEQTSWYFYAYFLAETSAPFPMLRKWGHDVPYVFHEGHCKFWQPETLPNFEYAMHALYMGNRLAWDPSLKPEEIYAEINQRFYGAAAKEMTAYWDHIDRCWVETDEYSGCGFGHLKRFTPDRMAEARRLMDAALASAQTPEEKFRIGLTDDSLKLLELFIKLRSDLAAGQFANLATDAETWKQMAEGLGNKYEAQSTFTKTGWAPKTVNVAYFNAFYGATYTDASRIANEGQILRKGSLRLWRFQVDKDKQGEAARWQDRGFDDRDWKTTDVAVDTWSSLGLHHYMNSVWYRTDANIPLVPAGKKIYLWLGSTDGSVKVFVNGRHVPYQEPVLDAAGQPTGKTESKEQASGYCQPFTFDITEAVKINASNVIAVMATRTTLNELGTGGLLAPAMIYCEK